MRSFEINCGKLEKVLARETYKYFQGPVGVMIINVELWLVPVYLLCLIILVCSLKITPTPPEADLCGYIYHLFCPLGSFVDGKSQQIVSKEEKKVVVFVPLTPSL